MIGCGIGKLHGQLRLQSEADTDLTTAGQYYKISGTFADGHASGFTVTDNKLKYTGPSGVCFHFSGASDLQVSKACEIVYSLFRNGSAVLDAQTPHTFLNPSKTSNISITSIIMLNQNDELEIYAKSNAANTTMSVKNLNIVFWG